MALDGIGQSIRSAWVYRRKPGGKFFTSSLSIGEVNGNGSDLRNDYFFPVAANAYTLTADTATFTSDTFPAAISRQRVVTATQADFVTSAQAAVLKVDR